jgi:pimeloyl-ACP methyl ester carboxylesterase
MKLELIHQQPKGKVSTTPLLFVHGKWHAAWCWVEHFLPYFAGHGYGSYALSLRGHGSSEGGEHLRWASIADYVNDVARVADELDTCPVIIGHSMGGYITQKFLETHSSPAAVLLASIPPSGLWPTTWSFFRRHPLVFLKAIAHLRMYPIVATPALAGEAFFSKSMPQERIAAYQARLGDESIRSYFDELGLNLVRPKEIKTPMLVLGAEKDTMILPDQIRATAQIYCSPFTIFPNMAHDMMLEAGWQAVAARILDFLKERGL